MSAVRSPSYPNISLPDALVMAAKIYGKYRTRPVDRENGAELIGYSSLSGPANKALAALASYGLVERAGKGEMRVTEKARDIMHPQSASQKSTDLLEAAMNPQLFGRIRQRYPDHLPPEEGIKSFLRREGFNESAVGPASKAFIETFRFVEAEIGSESRSESINRNLGFKQDVSAFDDASNPEPERPAFMRQRNRMSGMREDIYTLPEGDVTFQWPEGLSADSFEEVKAWIGLLLRKLQRHVISIKLEEHVDEG